jgi:hypothetical protein
VSGWELFTWINAGILGVGAVFVFVAFLRDLPGLISRSQPPQDDLREGEPER